MPVFNAFRKYEFTGRAFNYNLVADSTGVNSRRYFYLRDIECDITQGTFGKVTLWFPLGYSDLLPRAAVDRLKDKDGNEIYPGGIWVLDGMTPITNNFGMREGFRSSATLTFETLPS